MSHFYRSVLNYDADTAIMGRNFWSGNLTGQLTDGEGSCEAYSHALETFKINRETLAVIFINCFA